MKVSVNWISKVSSVWVSIDCEGDNDIVMLIKTMKDGIYGLYKLVGDAHQEGIQGPYDYYVRYDDSNKQISLSDGTTKIYSGHIDLFKRIDKIKINTNSIGKMYRFLYEGGTRAGQKRAVKIVSTSPTYVNCIDLDTGDSKNYSFSKMSEIEEIK